MSAPTLGHVVVVTGLEMMPSGGAHAPGDPAATPEIVKAYAIAVVGDVDGQDLAGLAEIGGPPPPQLTSR